MYTNMQYFLRRVEKELQRANGRRRMRLCNMHDVEQVIIEAICHREGIRIGGLVANAYDYPAWTTSVYCSNLYSSPYRGDYGFELRIGVINAHRKRRHVPDTAGIRFSRNIAQQIRRNVIARERAKSQKIVESIPDVVLTRELSVAAGNCPRETERVALWFTENAVSAKKVAEAAIERGEFNLLYFIKKAADYAAKEAKLA